MLRITIESSWLNLDFSLCLPKRKKKVKELEPDADTHINDEITDNSSIDEIVNDLDEESALLEYGEDIREMALQFESELRTSQSMNDIPEYVSDDILPPRFNTKDGLDAGVEIVTDKYEKEIEDVLEGRR